MTPLVMVGDDLITEYIVSPLYKRLLYNYAPLIEITKIGQGLTGISSKYLESFTVMTVVKKSDIPLQEVNGFAKVMAVSLFLGERDFNPGNLGIREEKNENNQKSYTLSKIDHGRSLSLEFEDARQVLKKLKEIAQFNSTLN